MSWLCLSWPFLLPPKDDEEKKQIADVEKRYRKFIDEHADAALIEEYFGSRGNARPALPESSLPPPQAVQNSMKPKKTITAAIVTQIRNALKYSLREPKPVLRASNFAGPNPDARPGFTEAF